jgi:thioredoxin 1
MHIYVDMKRLLGAILIFLPAFVAMAQSEDNFLTPEEFRTAHESHPEWQLVDVRTPDEFSKDRIQSALNVDYNGAGFKEQVRALDPTRPVLIYCLSGGRSARAAAYMRDQGLKVFELKGGLLQWRSKDFPLQRTRPVAEGLSLDKYKALTSTSLVLVDFHAPWCAPCLKMAPELKALAGEMSGRFSLLTINVDENNIVVRALKIESLPVLMLYRNGEVVWSTNHYIEKADLANILKKHF